MSYILEALKRAEAEREKGAVPGLGSQTWTANNAQASIGAGRQGWWLAIGLSVIVALGLSLWLWRQGAASEAPARAKPSEISVGSVPPSPTPAVAVAPAPAPAVPVAPPAAAPATASVVQATAKPKAAKPLAASAASAADRVLKWAELSPAEHQKLPKLRWGGAMYSPDPSARMVIVNDQVMREGEAIVPGLLVERIEAKSVILNLHGQRIRWDF